MVFSSKFIKSQKPPGKLILNDCTWQEISEIASSGKASTYFSVGDVKKIVLSGTVGQYTFNDLLVGVFIIGINHNPLVEGNNLIHFQFSYQNINYTNVLDGGYLSCFVDSEYGSATSNPGYRMNLSATNSRGWEESYMRRELLGRNKANASGTFLGALPEDLLSVIKPCNKSTKNGLTITNTSDYLFLQSEYEIYGTDDMNPGDAMHQKQYDLYKLLDSKLKLRVPGFPSSANYWLRTNYAKSGTSFAAVGTLDSTGVFEASANYSYAIAPCFCV